MTEEELTAIAASLRLAVQDSTDNVTAWYSRGQNDAFDDLAALLAEVRRLRGLLSALVEAAPAWPGDGPDQVCLYCDADLSFICTHDLGILDPHKRTCPWRLAYEALHTNPLARPVVP